MRTSKLFDKKNNSKRHRADPINVAFLKINL